MNNWTTLGKHPSIHRGAYHFFKASQDPLDQAKNFLSVIGTIDAKDLPPCLDMEWDVNSAGGDAWSNLSSDEIVDRALKWLNAVETATGRIPIIYTANAWWSVRIKPDKMKQFERYPIWIADYSTKGLGEEKPNVPQGRNWTIWQFTEKGLMAQGLPGNVDANIFKGTLAEFRQTFGIVLTSTTPTTPTDTTTPTNKPNSLPSSPTGGSTAPNSPPTKNASVAPPKSGNTNPTTPSSSNATRRTPRRSNNAVNDDSFGFNLRGGRNIPVE